MRNPNQTHQDEDDASWEIRAFAEDTTGNIMGTTWPPRFYNCTFCGREFRSAQALGGHMNIHRRDRARFHQQTQPNSIRPTSSSTSSFTVPTTKTVYDDNGGICLFYQLPNNDIDFLNSITSSCACIPSPPTTPHPSNSPTASSLPSLKSRGDLRGTSSSSSYCSHISSKGDESSISIDHDGDEKLDLELRLGHRPSPT